MQRHTAQGLIFIGVCVAIGVLLFVLVEVGRSVPVKTEAATTAAQPEVAPVNAAATDNAEPIPTATPSTAPGKGTPSRYADYPAESLNGDFVKPDFSGSQSSYAMYRTRIIDAANGGAQLGGRYAVAQFGCGTDCTAAFIIDGATGRIIDFPLGGEDNPDLALYFKPESRLIKSMWGYAGDANPICHYVDFELDNGTIRKIDENALPGVCPTE
jgi:hypothetical protein